MNEQEKIEAYLSDIRHDLRSQLMVVREGTSIILDNLVGSNCENCFALLRPALASTNEINKLIGESLSTPRFLKLISPLLSAKDEELKTKEKLLRLKEEEGMNLKKDFLRVEAELENLKKQLLERREEGEALKEQLLGKEEELRSVKRELLRKEEELKSAKKGSSERKENLTNVKEEALGHDLEILTYELMGMISHVVRTPLAVVKESLSLVLDEIPGALNPQQRELLSNGKKNVDNLIQSIEELSQESWDEIVYWARKHFTAEAILKRDKIQKKKRILIVEDQPLISNMLKMRLEANNYEVITAGDGQEGLEKARKENPNLIILDIMLPKMNGYQICQLLKSDPVYQKIPIIISSGRTPQEIRKVGKEVGADAFVSKPFEAEELLSRMKELLEEKKK